MKTETVAPVDELAKEIADLSNGVQKLLAGKLTERALITLIHDAIPGTYGGRKLANRQQIKEVLHAASNLKELFIKRETSRGGDNVR